MEETTTDIVIATPGGVSLGVALHMDTHFATAAQYSAGGDASEARWMTWATGNNEKFAKNGKTPLENARGWIIDRPDEDEAFPDDYELMDAMELLVEQGLAQECVISRQDEAGKSRKVPSWHLPVASLFIVCQGIPSKTEMLADPACRWGVAYSGWKQGAKSYVAFNCFIKELMDAGYNGMFHTRFSSFLTDKALACLKSQEYVLKFVDGLRAKTGNTEPVAWYAYAQPIQCSAKTLTARKGTDGPSKELYYPVPGIPRLSQRDPQAAIDYLARMACTSDQAFIIEDDGRVERAIEWSVKASQPNNGDNALYSDDDASGTGDYVPVDIDGNPVKSPF